MTDSLTCTFRASAPALRTSVRRAFFHPAGVLAAKVSDFGVKPAKVGLGPDGHQTC